MQVGRSHPAGKWCQNDVVSTSMRRDHFASNVASTSLRHYYVICPLGRTFITSPSLIVGSGDLHIFYHAFFKHVKLKFSFSSDML